eukprot:948040-Prorocentrum_minimum.AAC.4
MGCVSKSGVKNIRQPEIRVPSAGKGHIWPALASTAKAEREASQKCAAELGPMEGRGGRRGRNKQKRV